MRTITPNGRRLALLILIFVAFSTLYNICVPAGEADGEVSHFNRLIYYARGGSDVDWRSTDAAISADTCNDGVREGQSSTYFHQMRQPPLYYVIGGLVLSPILPQAYWFPELNYYAVNRGVADGGLNILLDSASPDGRYAADRRALHLSRFYSTIIGILGIIGLYQLGNQILGHKIKESGLLIVIFVAFNPIFLYSASTVNNDIMVATVGIWTSYFIARFAYKKEIASLIAAILLLGVSISVKLSGMVLVIVIVSYCLLYILSHTNRRFVWLGFALLLTIVFVFLFSFIQVVPKITALFVDAPSAYGTILLRIANMERSYEAVLKAFPKIDIAGIKYVIMTSFGLFGHDSIYVPLLLMAPIYAFLIISIIGLFKEVVNTEAMNIDRQVGIISLISFAISALVLWIITGYPPRGRYLIALLPMIGIVLLIGTQVWKIGQSKKILGYALALYLLFLNLIIPSVIIAENYRSIASKDEVAKSINEEEIGAIFGDFAQLVSLTVVTKPISPFHEVEINLLWKVLKTTPNNYLIGVNLETNDLVHVGGTTHFAENGKYSTSLWQPGDFVSDTYRFSVHGDTAAGAPEAVRAKITMFCAQGSNLNHLPVHAATGGYLGEAVYSSPVRFERILLGNTRKSQVERSSDAMATFGGSVELRNVRFANLQQRAGWAVPVLLRWRTLGAVSEEIKASVQILDGAGKWVAGDDKILSPVLPSALWKPGDLLTVVHWVELPADLPAGSYRVVVTVYNSATSDRLGAVDADGLPLSDNAVTIGDITVH